MAGEGSRADGRSTAVAAAKPVEVEDTAGFCRQRRAAAADAGSNGKTKRGPHPEPASKWRRDQKNPRRALGHWQDTAAITAATRASDLRTVSTIRTDPASFTDDAATHLPPPVRGCDLWLCRLDRDARAVDSMAMTLSPRQHARAARFGTDLL